MKLPIFQIDAFAEKVFSGNPAAVCPLDAWLSDEHMQAIAAENNLAETAFFVSNGPDFDLRWFTPKFEIDLCGHATLASAFVLYAHLGYQGPSITFHTKSGPLKVTQIHDQLSMDFPSRPPEQAFAPDDLQEGLNISPLYVGKSRDYLVRVGSEAEVRACAPVMERIARLNAVGVIVTAEGEAEGVDFVSRFFAPQAGVPEDPVTGSAHSTLIPFWADILGKNRMVAHQISERGGVLHCGFNQERVTIAGKAVTFLKGEIMIDG
ncbi:MAG: PhzF family phenazine biosynthesis protein [Bacteroidota bacterium]